MARKKNANDDPDQPDNAENGDDTFGLPEIEYEPLKRDEPVQTEQTTERTTYQSPEQPTYREQVHTEYTNTYDYDDEGSSPWPKIFAVLAILALAGAAYWYFGKYQPAQRAEKERQELAEKEAREKKAREERLAAEENARLDAERRRADSLANITTKEGSIETLSDRTRRYYVVVASAIDGDLIMDHAKRLSAKGVSTKIIPPFGKHKFYRLAIAEGDNYTDTQATADGMKAEYGEGIWVIRY
ncbi:MAG TPA: hypothetical protein VEB86_16955 [Chryseosolibacter sp.]|nr:hypothetical protein [Chryseosolibacter sp.]